MLLVQQQRNYGLSKKITRKYTKKSKASTRKKSPTPKKCSGKLYDLAWELEKPITSKKVLSHLADKGIKLNKCDVVITDETSSKGTLFYHNNKLRTMVDKYGVLSIPKEFTKDTKDAMKKWKHVLGGYDEGEYTIEVRGDDKLTKKLLGGTVAGFKKFLWNGPEQRWEL